MGNFITARRFRVALSFPGEYKNRVSNIAEELARELGKDRVLYYPWYAAEFNRVNLDTYLGQLYQRESDLIACFHCKEYNEKEWCGLEWRACRALLKKRQDDALMFFKLDDDEIPGIYEIDGYQDIRDIADFDVAAAILSRLEAMPVRSQLSVTLGALFAAIEISRAATQIAVPNVSAEIADEAMRNAISQKLNSQWALSISHGEEPIGKDLQRAVRIAWLKSLDAVATAYEFWSQPAGALSAWIDGIGQAVRAELEILKRPASPEYPNFVFTQPPRDYKSGSSALKECLLEEIQEELSVVRERKFGGGTIFMQQLHRSMAGWGLIGTNCPAQLWAMFAEGWRAQPMPVDDSLQESAGHDGLLNWTDLLAGYFADMLRQDSQMRIAFENQVLRHSGLREGVLEPDGLAKALLQVAAPVGHQLKDLLRSHEAEERSLRDRMRQPRQTPAKEPGGLAALFEKSEALGRIKEDLGGFDVKLTSGKAALEDFQKRQRRIRDLLPVAESKDKRQEVRLSSQEEIVLQAYLEWVVREFRYLPNGLQLNRELIPFPLDRVYVTVRGYPGTVTELQNRSASGAKTPATLRERDRRKYFATPPPVSIDLARAFRDSPTMVILGDPGSGKTTLSRWLALNFGRAMLAPQTEEVMVSLAAVDSSVDNTANRVSLGLARLPIFVRIADLTGAQKSEDQPLADLLAYGKFKSRPVYPEGHQQEGKEIERSVLGDLFMRYIVAQRAVVLLDGLDEVGSVKERLKVVERVHAFTDQYYGSGEGNHLVVTSRVVGYEGNSLRNSVARYTIEPMDPAAIRVFSHSWHTGWSDSLQNLPVERRREEAERVSQSLLAQIFAEGAVSLQQIAANPLMLSLLCALNLEGGEKLPESRAELYAALVDRELQESWLRRHPGRGELRDVVIRLLAFVAESMHRTIASGVIDRTALEETTQKIVERDRAFNIIAASAHELTAGVQDGAGFLVERGFRQYSFRHQTIQEYLAAVALVADPASAAERIWDHGGDSRWNEVLLFALGILASRKQDDYLARVCNQLLAKEDEAEERSPGVTLLLASAMGQIPDFPLDVFRKILERLFVRYSQLSIHARQAAFCDTVEEIFFREIGQQHSDERREATLSLLREYAGSEILEQQQAAAAIVASRSIVDARLTEKLVRAVRRDRSHGQWRIRRSLIISLSRALSSFPPVNDVDAQLLSMIDGSALAVLQDQAKIQGSRHFDAQRRDASERFTVPENLFPLRRRLLNDGEMLEFLRSSQGWMKVAIALQGGLCQVGLEELEQSVLMERAKPHSMRADGAESRSATQLDCEIQPMVDLLRSIPLAFDPALIWRGSPLSGWLADLLEERASEQELTERLVELWNHPKSDEVADLIADFEWQWQPKDSRQPLLPARAFLMTDVLVALAALGTGPNQGLDSPLEAEAYESCRLEYEWLEAYLKEPAYRATFVLEKSFDAPGAANSVPAASETASTATMKAVETAFPDLLWPESPQFQDPRVGILWRAFSGIPMTSEDQAGLDNLTTHEFLNCLAVLATAQCVPWLSENEDAWIYPCLSRSQPSSFVLMILLGIKRIPATQGGLRSVALRTVGQLDISRKVLLGVALHLARDWDSGGEQFRSALRPWVADDVPESDEAWKALHDRKTIFADPADAVTSFWAIRLSEPKDRVARRHWLSSLYVFARLIADPIARLGAELQVFTLCDTDEAMPQWRRIMRLAETLTDATPREAWIARLQNLRALAVEKQWSIETDQGSQSMALAGFVSVTSNRPIKVFSPLGVFNDDRPYALAMYWAYLLLNDSDDPVYSCAVVLDTMGKNLGSSMDDLLRSLVLLETQIGLPHFQEWPVMPISQSHERRRDLLSTALLVLFRIPQNYHMLVEWFLRRMIPYLRRLDQEFLPLAITVASRLKEANRTPLLQILCPGAEGDAEAALDEAWRGLAAIPDPYLRWRSEWVLYSVSRRKRSVAAMVADIVELANPNERFVCMTLVMMNGEAEVANDANWQRLLTSLPERHMSALRELQTPTADLQRALDPAGVPIGKEKRKAAIESAIAWVREWAKEKQSLPEIAAAAVIDLQLRSLEQNQSNQGSAAAEFWKRVSLGQSMDESLVGADAATGLKFMTLTGEAVDLLRKLIPAEIKEGASCPVALQMIRGASPEAIPFLHNLVSGRRDIWGNWAALMLAEGANWSKEVVLRVRALLESPEPVLRNRALFSLVRGGDLGNTGNGTGLLSAAQIGREVIDEMAATLAPAERFHPVVDMTMVFALDRVVFDNTEQVREWLSEAARHGATQKKARAVLENICRASPSVCRLIASSLPSPIAAVNEALIRASICLWERGNFRNDAPLWSGIRKGLLAIGGSNHTANANKAIEALGHIGIGEHGGDLVALASRNSARMAPVLRALGIASEGGRALSEAEKHFVFGALAAQDPLIRVAAAEAELRRGTPLMILEQLVPHDLVLSALVARLDSYFVGEVLVRKAREAGAWLELITHVERLTDCPVKETTFAKLLQRISLAASTQSFASERKYPAHEHLSGMLAIAASAAELMPDTCEALLEMPASSLNEDLQKVVLRHSSYVARQAALILLSFRRKFSAEFAGALESALGDLSILQTTAIECVARIEALDDEGLAELARLVTSPNTLIAFAAARVIQGITASTDLLPEMRTKFERTMADLLHRELSSSASEEPRVAFAVDSSLSDWTYRPLFLGLVREAKEDALFALRYPASTDKPKTRAAGEERVELELTVMKRNESVRETLTFGPHTAKSKHPAMHQSVWCSAEGETIPADVMEALEKVQKVHQQLGVSFAKLLHLTVQSRFTQQPQAPPKLLAQEASQG